MTLRLSLKEIAYSEYRFLRKKVFRRYLVWIMSAMILFYQRRISKHTCLYSPTCSQYMLESLNRFGAVVGLIMGCWRILRCNPFSKGGYDPVPEKFWHYVWLK